MRSLHGFEYVWEVYKPAAARRWDYYVLPVAWDEHFVARFDARCEGGCLSIHAWHWEPGIDPVRLPVALAGDLEVAAAAFLDYLGASSLRLPCGLGRAARAASLAAARGVRHGGGSLVVTAATGTISAAPAGRGTVVGERSQRRPTRRTTP